MAIGWVLIMSVTFVVRMSDETQRYLQHLPADVGSLLLGNLRRAALQFANETEAHLQRAYLTGGDWRTPRRGSTPLAVRSNDLRGSTRSGVDHPLTAWIGAGFGRADRYAHVLLGEEKWNIRPKGEGHLWIPIADNLTGSGQMRMSPRDVMGMKTPTGKRLARIFKSKRGNLVVVVPEAREASSLTTRQRVHAKTNRRFQRGPKRGMERGRLMFVLKKEVEIEGTGALVQAIQDKMERLEELLQDGVDTTMDFWRVA